ncbi:MAG: FIST C-terminal domain-containing protein [Actinomycetota bacterium]|nr:FIST C-terminal domain-containing protein [Actinomycetota bacterium]
MPFASALSEHPIAATAPGEAVGQVLDQLGKGPQLAVLFVTTPHAESLADIAGVVVDLLAPGTLVGCVAESVAGTGREVEHRSALSLWAGSAGPLIPLELESVGSRGPIMGWPESVAFEPSAVLLVGDPFSFPVEPFFEWLATTHPGLPVIGGMASGARTPGRTRLVIDGRVRSDGAVGVLLGPGAHVRTEVSQGCRPIGFPWMVTRADGNVIQTLAGKPPLERLEALAQGQLTAREVALINQGGLQVGKVINEHKASFGTGDFRIVGIMGADRRTGAIALADAVSTGSTVQFHLRDAEAADAELRQLLANHLPASERRSPDAALLFTCNGRGTRLFPHPHHDASVISELLGEIPVGGFFASGEFGPVGGRNFLHSFTASIALFSD